ncbi:unnamed protein product [Phytophthora fragariaefolia]|uniref:Unnamed protein product n=1 Tax=Phytophthora fragariaefolia TaxID=1490495 RepID=A0A9W6X970_9STRA|nr:unnamed protein product [Phytophthora fragariaefolia]
MAETFPSDEDFLLDESSLVQLAGQTGAGGAQEVVAAAPQGGAADAARSGEAAVDRALAPQTGGGGALHAPQSRRQRAEGCGQGPPDGGVGDVGAHCRATVCTAAEQRRRERQAARRSEAPAAAGQESTARDQEEAARGHEIVVNQPDQPDSPGHPRRHPAVKQQGRV